jgi:hypothetical protein
MTCGVRRRDGQVRAETGTLAESGRGKAPSRRRERWGQESAGRFRPETKEDEVRRNNSRGRDVNRAPHGPHRRVGPAPHVPLLFSSTTSARSSSILCSPESAELRHHGLVRTVSQAICCDYAILTTAQLRGPSTRAAVPVVHACLSLIYFHACVFAHAR